MSLRSHLLSVLIVIFVGNALYARGWHIPTERQSIDPRIPLLKIKHPNGRGGRASAVFIALHDDKAWYLTNHHTTPMGEHSDYTLVAGEHSYEARFVKHDRNLDLGLLVAAKPVDNISPLKIAARPPPPGAGVAIYGWSHGQYFSRQTGKVLGYSYDWCTVSVGANQGQSGGAFFSDGLVIGITSRTDKRTSSGAGVNAIRRFLEWKVNE